MVCNQVRASKILDFSWPFAADNWWSQSLTQLLSYNAAIRQKTMRIKIGSFVHHAATALQLRGHWVRELIATGFYAPILLFRTVNPSSCTYQVQRNDDSKVIASVRWIYLKIWNEMTFYGQPFIRCVSLPIERYQCKEYLLTNYINHVAPWLSRGIHVILYNYQWLLKYQNTKIDWGIWSCFQPSNLINNMYSAGWIIHGRERQTYGSCLNVTWV